MRGTGHVSSGEMGKEGAAERNCAKFCDRQIHCLLTMNPEGIEEAKVKALYNKDNYKPLFSSWR